MPLHAKYLITRKLANYLRINGDSVINGSSKLSLGTSALCLLNNVFLEVLNEEWEPKMIMLSISPSEAECPEIDINFLLNFIQQIKSLKLFHQVQTLRGGVDISQFKNLTTLELRKLPAHLIVGLNCLANQLKALICSRSLYLLKEIFGTSLNEQNEPIVWTELKELNFSYNYLETLDKSLKSIPNVTLLDLSHNQIKNVDEIESLSSLTFVNLSYNQLNSLPVFHISSCRSLTKLYMRNNNLEDLVGLDCFFNLEELDVAYNLLSEYHALAPLDKLKSLRTLNFEGNPLYFHKKHYTLVLKCVNESVIRKGLILNGKQMVCSNYLINDSVQNISNNQHQTSINTVVGHAENVYIPANREFLTRSIGEISGRSSYEDNSASSVASQFDKEHLIPSEANNGKKQGVRKKKKKLREALISERVESNLEAHAQPSKITGRK